MANRVVIGKRGSDFGLFISKNGEDVFTTTNPLGFDSRAAGALNVHSFGQGILVPNIQHRTTGAQLSYTYSGTSYNQHTVTITHNLGYIPAFAVRWCTGNEISSGVATKVWNPFSYYEGVDSYVEEEDGDETEFPGADGSSGLVVLSSSTSTIVLKNVAERAFEDSTRVKGKATSIGDSAAYFYSYVIFTEPNFTNGESL